MSILTLAELIPQLEEVNQELENSAHSINDDVRIIFSHPTLEFPDASISNVSTGLRIGCACPEECHITIELENTPSPVGVIEGRLLGTVSLLQLIELVLASQSLAQDSSIQVRVAGEIKPATQLMVTEHNQIILEV